MRDDFADPPASHIDGVSQRASEATASRSARLANSLKHAAPTTATVALRYGGQSERTQTKPWPALV